MPWVRSRYSAAIVPMAACRPALGSGSDIGISVGPPPGGPVAAVMPARASISEP